MESMSVDQVTTSLFLTKNIPAKNTELAVPLSQLPSLELALW